MSPKLAEKLGVKLTKLNGKIKLAKQGVTAVRIGETPPLRVRLGTRVLDHVFEVLDMGEDTNCILGIDFQGKCAIGVPVDLPEEEDSTEVPVKMVGPAPPKNDVVATNKQKAMTLVKFHQSLIHSIKKILTIFCYTQYTC